MSSEDQVEESTVEDTLSTTIDDILNTNMTNLIMHLHTCSLKNMQSTPFSFLHKPKVTKKEANKIAGRRFISHPKRRKLHEE